MATYKYGDIARPDDVIDNADVEALKDIILNGTLPTENSLNYILTNVTQKDSYQDLVFFEVLKLTKNRASMPEYTGTGFEVSSLSGKGKQIDTTTDRFVASFPYAKITNVYPNEEYVGIAKVYIKSSETNKYVEDSILFTDIKRIAVNPATGATADEAGTHLHFGEDSVAIDSSSGKHYAGRFFVTLV